MTQRERHTADGGAPKAPPSLSDWQRAASTTGPASSVPSPPFTSPLGVGSVWEEWYLRASPEQRREILSLAVRQGVLHARQLGNPPNVSPATTRRPLLSALLTGQVGELEPLHPADFPFHDTDLDPAQRDAVARALSTPDVCCIQGPPGTGKSRVTAEVLVQAVERGWRVLLLAPSPPAIDRALELLGPCESAFPIRCLSPAEPLDSLPPCIRRLTMAERLRTFEQQTQPAAREALLEAERRLELRHREEKLWARLDEIAGRSAPLAERLGELERRIAAVADTVAGELTVRNGDTNGSGALQPRVADLTRTRDENQAQLDARLAVVRAESAKVRAEQAKVANERGNLLPLIEARAQKRFMSLDFWKARFRGLTLDQVAELNQRAERLTTEEERLGKEIEELETERRRVERQFLDDLDQLRSDETTRQRAVLESQAASWSREQTVLLEEWQSACRGFGEGTTVPGELRLEALQAARETWDRQVQKESQALDFARAWSKGVEESLPGLADRLVDCTNLVAATTTGLSGDAHFGDRGPAAVPFDLLVLEDAHEVTEADFLHAARRACRWVLVGLPTARTDTPAAPSRKPRHIKVVPPPALRPGFFQRLWNVLHDDPRRLPRSWFQRDGRIICRLRPLAASDERSLQTEWVADRPEIELRILDTAPGHSELAEVVFPGAWSIQEAKEYVFRELDEVRVDPHGHTFRWGETAESVSLVLANGDGKDLKEISLGAGVHEWIGPTSLLSQETVEGQNPWHTYRIEFRRSDGWTLERAERWVQQYLTIRPLGRTALFSVAHRMEPALGSLLTGLMGEGVFEPTSAVAEAPGVLNGESVPHGLPIQFIPVPDPPEYGEARRRGGTASTASLSSSVKGAGFELDLDGPRHPDQLPSDLRALLPPQGLINYLEALAVVRALKDLLDDPAFLSDANDWHRRQAVSCACDPARAGSQWLPVASTHCPTVALIALYPAQVELIRRLMEGVVVQAPGFVRIQAGTPSDFVQRECMIALISLTRSHTHRAVPFGEGPQQLALALTRAARRVWIFGDPGTLARRCQWSGPLDHLDEAAAERERGLILRLCRFLQRQTAPAPGSRSLEGSGV